MKHLLAAAGLSCCLAVSLAPAPALAQTSVLNPFQFKWSASVGSNGVARPQSPTLSQEHVSLDGSTGLHYGGNPASLSPDGTIASFDLIANGPASGPPYTYSVNFDSTYQAGPNSYRSIHLGGLPGFQTPATGDELYTADATQLCSVRVNIIEACDTPTRLQFNAFGSNLSGHFQGNAEDTSANARANPDQSAGFVVNPDAASGGQRVTGELALAPGDSGSVSGTIFFTTKAPWNFNQGYTTPAAGACVVDVDIPMDASVCVNAPPPPNRVIVPLSANISIDSPASGCDSGAFTGCPAPVSGRISDFGYFDLQQSDYYAFAGAFGGSSVSNGVLTVSGGVWAGWTSIADPNYRNIFAIGNPGATTVFFDWGDGRKEQLYLPSTAGAGSWGPVAVPNASPGAGVYPNGWVVTPRNQTTYVTFEGPGAVINGSVSPQGCFTASSLDSTPDSSWYSLTGIGDHGPSFIGPNRFTSAYTGYTGLYGAGILTYLYAAHGGDYQGYGLAGGYNETLWHLSGAVLTPADPKNYLHESLDVLPDAPRSFTLDAATQLTAPPVAIPFGKLNVRMIVNNPPGSGTPTRRFRLPQLVGSTASGPAFVSQAVNASGPDQMQYQHLLHVVATPGPFSSSSLHAMVPVSPTDEKVQQDTQFPNIGPVTILAPDTGGVCRAVCVDAANPTVSYLDDELPPVVAFDAVPATAHAGTGTLIVTGTATDETPIGSVVANGAPGTITQASGNHTATFSVPVNIACGANPFSVQVQDKCGGSASGGFSVTGTDLAPTFSVADQTVIENHAVSITVAAVDPETDPLIYAATTLPSGATFDAPTHTLHWVPQNSQGGLNPIAFTVTDPCFTVSASANINVLVNHPPVLAQPGPFTVAETKTLAFTLTSTDPDNPTPGDTASYTSSNLPAGMTLDPNTGAVTWTPGYQTNEVYDVVYRVTDGGGLHNEKTAHIVVTRTNAAPSFSPAPDRTIPEAQTLTFTVAASDPNGDPITYSASGLPPGATFDAATRTFSFTPDYSRASKYPIVFSARDNDPIAPLTGTLTVQVTVTNVDRAPVLTQPGPFTTHETVPLVFTVVATDPDNPITSRNPDIGDTLAYTATSLPRGAAFDPDTQQLSWTPDCDQAGSYTVTFRVQDNWGLSDQKLAQILVIDTNRAPVVAQLPEAHGAEGQWMTFALDVRDPDADPFSCSITAAPAGARLDPDSLLFSWQPDFDHSTAQAGPQLARFSCCDRPRSGQPSLCSQMMVPLTVDEVNRPPLFDLLPLQVVHEGDALAFTVTAHDPDVESALVFSAQNLPPGAAFNAATQTLAWTPDFTQAGEYEPLFAVTDGQYRDRLAVHIQVLNTNRPPVISPVPTLTVAVGSMGGLGLAVTDPDGDFISCSLSALPAGAAFDAGTRFLSFTPAQAGSFNATARCCDKPSFVESLSLCAEAPIKLVAAAVNNPPPTVDPRGPYSVLEGYSLSFTVGTRDPDGETVSCALSPLPAGAIYDDISRSFSWNADYGQAGVYTIHVECQDAHAAAGTDVLITVRAGTYDRLGGGIATGCGSSGAPGAGAFLLLMAAVLRRRQSYRRSSC